MSCSIVSVWTDIQMYIWDRAFPVVQLDCADNMLSGKIVLGSFTHIIIKHSSIFFNIFALYAADRVMVQMLLSVIWRKMYLILLLAIIFFHLKIKSKFSVLKASQLYHVKDEVRMYKPVDITHSSPHTTPLPPAQKKIN